MQITLDGTEQIGDKITTLRTVAYWFQDIEDGRPMSKLEISGYVDGTRTFRIVGDGTTAWAYDMVRNEYTANRYGNFSGAQPPTYVNALFSTLKSVIRGQHAYPLRLLTETYSGEVARYTTWAPGTTVEDNGQTVRYELGDPVRRRLEFWYHPLVPNTVIDHVDFYDKVSLGSRTREITWSMTISSFDIALEEDPFTFVPPAGSRAVSGLRPVTGG